MRFEISPFRSLLLSAFISAGRVNCFALIPPDRLDPIIFHRRNPQGESVDTMRKSKEENVTGSQDGEAKTKRNGVGSKVSYSIT